MSNTTIKTNIFSLNAHRNLSNVSTKQAKASQRLSSGFRINSAADDAAGLGISEKMRAQIRGLDRASLNAQDGISLIQTAEGAISTINEKLIRLRELLVQAANDTNIHTPGQETQSDRARIQDEIDQLMIEINSVAHRTEFNTRTLLNGSLSHEGIISGGSWHTVDEVIINAPAKINTLDQFLRMTSNEPFIGNFGDLLNAIGANLEGKSASEWIAVHASANFAGLEAALDAAMAGRWQYTEHISGLRFNNANDLLNSFIQGMSTSSSSWAEFVASNPNLSASTFARAVSQTGGEAIYQALIRAGFQGLGESATFNDVRNTFYRLGGGWGLGGLRDELVSALSLVSPGHTQSWLEKRVREVPGTVPFSAVLSAAFTETAPLSAIGPLSTPPIPDVTLNINTLTEGDSGAGWNFTGGVLNITGGGTFQINGTGVATNRSIAVETGNTANVILNNTNIVTNIGAALDMRGATVGLWLEGSNTLTSTLPNNLAGTVPRAGVETTGGTLTINGTGSLIANGADSGHGNHGGGAGIGGAGQASNSADQPAGNIIINSGTVTANGGSGYGSWSAAGIGGGGGMAGYVSAGNITINGGIVRATGGRLHPANAIGSVGNSAAIGGGNQGGGANVTINGGLVEIPVGHWIGRGNHNINNGVTTITGGNLSIANPEINIRGGAVNSVGQSSTRVQIFLYTGVGAGWIFDPLTTVTYTLGGTDINAITDSAGRLFMYLPASSAGILGSASFTRDGITHMVTGSLITMNANHNDRLVFVPHGVIPPPESEWPIPPYPSFPDAPIESPEIDLWDIFSRRYLRANTQIVQREIWLADERERGAPLWFQIGANSGQGITVGINGMTTRHLAEPHDLAELIDVENPSGIPISDQLGYIDRALEHTTRERSFLGAVQNRLEFTKQNLDIASENLSTANSRVRDTDMALEMMTLTQANVLQQAAISMLAQANQSPQSVLQLLE